MVQTAGRAADPLAAYRPAAVALGVALIAGAVSNAALSTLTAWTAERFAARLKAKLFGKIMSNDQARRSAASEHACAALLRMAVSHVQRCMQMDGVLLSKPRWLSHSASAPRSTCHQHMPCRWSYA